MIINVDKISGRQTPADPFLKTADAKESVAPFKGVLHASAQPKLSMYSVPFPTFPYVYSRACQCMAWCLYRSLCNRQV
jgi:hypothetical protein